MTTSTGDCLLSTFKIPLLDGYLNNLLFQSELRRWGFAVAAMPAVLFLNWMGATGTNPSENPIRILQRIHQRDYLLSIL
jgi:hypothetical protein